jgi:hypothetical protein
VHKRPDNHGGARKGAGRRPLIEKRPNSANPNGVKDFATTAEALDILMTFGANHIFVRRVT